MTLIIYLYVINFHNHPLNMENLLLITILNFKAFNMQFSIHNFDFIIHQYFIKT